MAELTPIPTAQRPSDPGYQPLSGYAVAAIITACVFLAILLVLFIQVALTRRSLFSWELLALPISGIILAWIARSHIRNSEGTRTGVGFANAAWWISVLGGAGFGAYMYANNVVLETESARFSDRFFKELKDGRVHHAFVYVLPPEERDRADPNSPQAFETAYAANGFAFFKNHEVVRLVTRNGSAVELERTGEGPRAVGDGFQATHVYRVSCPEGDFNVQVKLIAAESRKGGKTQMEWRIPPTRFRTLRRGRSESPRTAGS